jgi:hypothetical protein
MEQVFYKSIKSDGLRLQLKRHFELRTLSQDGVVKSG